MGEPWSCFNPRMALSSTQPRNTKRKQTTFGFVGKTHTGGNTHQGWGEGVKVMSDIIPLIRSLLQSPDIWEQFYWHFCSYFPPWYIGISLGLIHRAGHWAVSHDSSISGINNGFISKLREMWPVVSISESFNKVMAFNWRRRSTERNNISNANYFPVLNLTLDYLP